MSDTLTVPLTKGYAAIIDAGDAPLVLGREWHVLGDTVGRPYAVDPDGLRPMHRVIMVPPPSLVIDHINGDTLDNRRANLRICTVGENCRNARKTGSATTSKFKGVWFERPSSEHGGKPWRARIVLEGKNIRLGRFDTEAEAAEAYDEAARRLHGEFAKTNADLGLYVAA